MPTANSGCSNECFFPQRPAEHPFIVDRFGHLKKHPLPGAAAARPKLRPEVEQLLMNHDWFWAITGVHQGGGMDTTMIIRKKGPAIDAAPPGVALAPAASVEAGGGGGGGGDGVALKRAQDALREAQRQQQLLHAQFSQLEEQVRPATAGGRPALCDGDGGDGDGDGPRPRRRCAGRGGYGRCCSALPSSTTCRRGRWTRSERRARRAQDRTYRIVQSRAPTSSSDVKQ